MPVGYEVTNERGERAWWDGKKLTALDANGFQAQPGAAQPSADGAASLGKLTEGQAKDGFNAKRMAAAGQTLSGLEANGYDAGLAQLTFGAPVGHVRNYNAARDEWIDSQLRLTTGAAVTPFEKTTAESTYFPKLGDDPDVRKQKAAARQRVERDALLRGGPGAVTPPAGTGGAQLSPGARDAYRRMYGQGRIDTKAAFGSEQNPYVAKSEAQMNRLPKGSYVITPEGHFGVVE